MWKNILAVVAALLVAWIAVKVIFAVLGFVIQAIGWLVVLALAAVVAIPVYLFVRQKLLS